MTNVAREVAKILIDLGCVQFSLNPPFTYASGLKGPIYCDNRKIMSHPRERSIVIKHLESLIKKNAQVDHIVGLATAGIPHGAMVAMLLNQSFLYVRSKAKEHGKGKQIEGDYSAGQSVYLIEDLVNQGSSLESAIEAMHAEKLEVKGIYCLVDYEMEVAKKKMCEWKIPLYSLTSFSALVETAQESKKLQFGPDQIQELRNWHTDPKAWTSTIN